MISFNFGKYCTQKNQIWTNFFFLTCKKKEKKNEQANEKYTESGTKNVTGRSSKKIDPEETKKKCDFQVFQKELHYNIHFINITFNYRMYFL